MLRNEYTGSKSDNAFGRHQTQQENTYLSRKIERQQLATDYYHGGSQGQIKRPVAVSQELAPGELTQWKKTVYTNMTSRVLDGHRKQEDLASSHWNSLMVTKSERGWPGSHS